MELESGYQLAVENFPLDLRRRIKVEAALRGLTMREAVIEAMGAWCAGEGTARENAVRRAAEEEDN